MKRKVTTVNDNEQAAKKLKVKETVPDAIAEDDIKVLETIQEKLLELDNKCVQEQLVIQQKYATLMRPLTKERGKIFKKIPNFWGRVLFNIPLHEETVLCENDKAVLQFLEDLELDDNIDAHGSYKLTLVFGPDADEFFTPSTLSKSVYFDEKGVEIDSTCTKIKWKDGKNIVDAVRRKRSEKTVDNFLDEFSIFEWFTEDDEEQAVPPFGDILRREFGEILRREVWQNPMAHFVDNDDDDSADDSEEEGDETY